MPIANPSNYQSAILSHASTERTSVRCIAVPGSGKTTTAIAVMEAIRSGGMSVAFNKAIQLHLETLIPRSWEAKTMHALGYAACRQLFRGRVITSKFGKAHKDLVAVTQGLPSRFKDAYRDASKAVAFAKRLGIGYHIDNESSAWRDLLDAYNIDIPRELHPQFLDLMPRIYKKILEDTTVITFDEMILFPLIYDLKTVRHANVVLDEAQDTSMLDLEFLHHKVLHENGRIIGFGDPRQSIYAFRGADSSATQHFADLFNSIDMPLSLSYRLPRTVADHVRYLCPELEILPDAPEGSVNYTQHEDHPKPASYSPDSLILCRNNAPLIAIALKFLRDNTPCQLRTDLESELQGFIKKMKTDDLKLFTSRLNEWYESEMDIAERDDRTGRMNWLDDRHDTMKVLIESASTVEDMQNRISAIYGKQFGPIVSTVHKAKGLEASNVYILRPDLMPSKRAHKPWEKQQEDNIKFVAMTRTKSNLTYLLPEED